MSRIKTKKCDKYFKNNIRSAVITINAKDEENWNKVSFKNTAFKKPMDSKDL